MKQKIISLALTVVFCMSLSVVTAGAVAATETISFDGGAFTLTNCLRKENATYACANGDLVCDPVYVTGDEGGKLTLKLDDASRAAVADMTLYIWDEENTAFRATGKDGFEKETTIFPNAGMAFLREYSYRKIDLSNPSASGIIKIYIMDDSSFKTARPRTNSGSIATTNNGSKVDSWALTEINKAEELGFVPLPLSGKDLTFNIERERFSFTAVELYEAMSSKQAPAIDWSTYSVPFNDCGDLYVMQAYELGIVNGDGTGNFNPHNSLSREEAAVILYRVYTLSGGTAPDVSSTAFADDANISSWAKSAVAFMSERGILNGVGNNKFDPKGKITSQQAIAIAVRMLEKLK